MASYPHTFSFSRLGRFGLCALALTAIGCAGSDKPLVSVSGVVTYGGGPWPQEGYITFNPIEMAEGLPNRPASARFYADGKFQAGSYQPGDGLLPGKYQVRITCYDMRDPSKSQEAREYVPKDFKPDDLVVEMGQDAIELNIDVPKKR